MIKLAFFDFSRTIAKGSGLNTGAAQMGREKEFHKAFDDFVSHKLNDEDFIETAMKLWRGFKEKDLPKIYPQIELRPNVQEVLKKLKEMQIKLALVTHMPINLAEIYRKLGFDYLFGTECEIKEGIFTGRVLKINPDKGFIVRDLSNELRIRLNECIAVGDSKADVPMFESVGYKNSFAIDANDEVKEYANLKRVISRIHAFLRELYRDHTGASNRLANYAAGHASRPTKSNYHKFKAHTIADMRFP